MKHCKSVLLTVVMAVFVWVLSGNLFSQTRVLAQEGKKTPAKSAPTGVTDKGKDSLHTVEKGDWVNVVYQFEVIKGNRPSHKNMDLENKTLEESFLVGDKPLMAGLGDAVRGMEVGEEKQVTFLPRDAFGVYNKRKIKQMPKVMNIPKTVRVNPRSYVKRFDAFPIEGQILDFQPYLSAKVLKVEEKFAKIEFLPKIGNYSDNQFGKTVVEMKNDRIKIQMEPFVGGEYKNDGDIGYVVSVSDDRFVVDFNHPLAGKTLEVEFTLSSLVKSKRLKQFHIPWKEDLDEGIDVSQKTNKPIFLLLYSKKCKWCEKLINETLTDPGIKGWKDQLVWIKIDSNKHPDIKEEFDQDSYPLTIILGPDGQVVKRIEGFMGAPAMRDELRKLLFKNV